MISGKKSERSISKHCLYCRKLEQLLAVAAIVRKTYTGFFPALLEEPSICLANVEWFWPFLIFTIILQSNTCKKCCEAKAEDQMLNKLGMRLLDLSSLAALFA